MDTINLAIAKAISKPYSKVSIDELPAMTLSVLLDRSVTTVVGTSIV